MQSSDSNEEKHLIRRCKDGDKMAFAELVHKHKRCIYSAAYQMTNNHSDADDLSQEAFLRAYQAIKSFKEKSSFNTWLYRIVVNLSINYLKKRSKLPEISLNEKMTMNGLSIEARYNDPGNPRRLLENREAHEKITSAIGSLPASQKATVVLVSLQGFSHREAAAVLGCPEKTVSWRLFQARKRLREDLIDLLGEE